MALVRRCAASYENSSEPRSVRSPLASTVSVVAPAVNSAALQPTSLARETDGRNNHHDDAEHDEQGEWQPEIVLRRVNDDTNQARSGRDHPAHEADSVVPIVLLTLLLLRHRCAEPIELPTCPATETQT